MTSYFKKQINLKTKQTQNKNCNFELLLLAGDIESNPGPNYTFGFNITGDGVTTVEIPTIAGTYKTIMVQSCAAYDGTTPCAMGNVTLQTVPILRVNWGQGPTTGTSLSITDTISMTSSTTVTVLTNGFTGSGTIRLVGSISCLPLHEEISIVEQPVWVTEFNPRVSSVAQTRDKTRHSRNPSISVLNQLSQQMGMTKLPLYHNFVNEGTEDKPKWACQLEFAGHSYVTTGHSTKHSAKTHLAAKVLTIIKETMSSGLSRSARLTLDSWQRDLTTEGVEPNPGPAPSDYDESIFGPWKEEEDFTPDQIRQLQLMMEKEQSKPQEKIIDNENLLDDMSEFRGNGVVTQIPVTDPTLTQSEIKKEDTEIPVMPKKQTTNSINSSEAYLAHVHNMAEYKGQIGEYFSVLKYVLTNQHSNRFAILANLTDIPDEPSDYTPDLSTPKRDQKPKTVIRKEKDKEEKQRNTQQPKPKQYITEEEKEQRRFNAELRIVEGLRRNMYKLVLWINKEMSTKFKTKILDILFGENWHLKQNMNQYEWIAYCWKNNITAVDMKLNLLTFDEKWRLASEELKLKVIGTGADLANQNTHNKVMHAYNGNPLFQSFKEVEESTDLLKFAEESDSILKPYTGIEAEKYITNIVGDVNPNQSRIYDQDRLRGNQYSSTGQVISNAVSTIPFTNLIPRTVRDNDDFLVDAATRLPITETNVTDYYVNPIRPTDLSERISDQIKNNQSSNWRRDNTSIAGFNSFDIATVNTALLSRGLSTESMTLKLDLLHSIMALQSDPNAIGKSLYQLIDNNTIPTPDDRAIININNSPVFGEDCGGNDPVYPFGGGTGSIAFHLTLQTVPEERRDKAIFCPPGLLQASRDAAEALALFVLSFTEWPFCLYTVSKITTDRNGDNAATQMFVPTQTITRIGGDRVLDVILPRRYAVSNPETQGAANTLVTVRPQCGPLGTTNLQPETLLNVNYIGGPRTEYQLTHYLYTWSLKFDITTIRQYFGRLAPLLGVKSQLWASHELNVAMCQVAPKMTTGVGGSGTQPRNSQSQFDLCYNNLLAMSKSQSDFPLNEQFTADIRVFETNISTWNKVILGLATADNITSEQNMHVPFEIGDPRANFWERLEAIPMCAAWTMYYHCRGVSSKAWNNAYTNTNNIWLQKMARETFSTTQSVGTIIPARYGKIVKNIFRSMFEREPARVQTSVGGEIFEITHFERWLPGNTYATVYSPTGTEIDLFPPTLIPDIWVQYPAMRTPKMAASFPPVYGQDSVQGFGKESKLLPFRNVNNNLVAPYMEQFVANQAYFPIREGPKIDDKVLWNSRLWITHPNVRYLDYAGQAIVETVPPQGHLPIGRDIPLAPGESQPDGVSNMSTTCVPRYSDDGRRVFVYLSTAESVPLIQACNRANRLARTAWLLLDVYIEPELQLLTDEVLDIFDQLTSKSFLGVQTAAAESAEGNIPATKAVTDLQAVDPATLPSTLDKSESMPQPAPLLAQPTTDSQN